jgi:hypothetical protein
VVIPGLLAMIEDEGHEIFAAHLRSFWHRYRCSSINLPSLAGHGSFPAAYNSATPSSIPGARCGASFRGIAGIKMERKTRFELATFSLARRCSTTEPLPLKFMLFGGEGETRTLTPCGT